MKFRTLACQIALGLMVAHCSAQSVNLIVNGSFEDGFTGFTNGYTFVATGTADTPGTFGIRSTTQDFNPLFGQFTDHTTGTGRMLIVDGSPVPSIPAWEQTVAVVPGADYELSFWAATAVSENLSRLRVTINGAQVGSDLQLVLPVGGWQLFKVAWSSGASSTATIRILDLVTEQVSNDFTVDDISFTPLTPFASIRLSQVEVCWNSITNRMYQVQYRSSLTTNTWVDLGVSVAGSGPTNCVTDSISQGQAQRFYRVVQLP